MQITLPKPLGIVFVESPLVDAYGKNRVMVGELVVGGNADRASRVAQLFDGRKNVASNTPILNGGVMPGDILRATTTVSKASRTLKNEPVNLATNCGEVWLVQRDYIVLGMSNLCT